MACKPRYRLRGATSANPRHLINQPLTFAADGGLGFRRARVSHDPAGSTHRRGRPFFERNEPCQALAGVSAQKEIADGLALQQGQPPSSLMLPAVLREVASLAKRHEIARLIVRRIVVAMRRRQNHPRRLERRQMTGRPLLPDPLVRRGSRKMAERKRKAAPAAQAPSIGRLRDAFGPYFTCSMRTAIEPGRSKMETSPVILPRMTIPGTGTRPLR